MPVTPLKGALVRVNRRGAVTHTFVFDLNPEQIHRRIHWRETGELDAAALPCERLSFKLVLDAVDALERPDQNPVVVQQGLRPQLALLESFIRPAEARPDKTGGARRAEGRALAPTLGFLWGRLPALPVWMVSLNVREELFDPMLNPLRASAWVELEVCPHGSNGAASVARMSKSSLASLQKIVTGISRPERERKVSRKS